MAAAPIRAAARALGAATDVFLACCVLSGAMLALMILLWALGLFHPFGSPAFWDARHFEWRIDPAPNDPGIDYPGLTAREVIERRIDRARRPLIADRAADDREILVEPNARLVERPTNPPMFDVFVRDPDERLDPEDRFLGRYAVFCDSQNHEVVRQDDPRDRW